MNTLYLVCGLPATGKTTLAVALSQRLDIVCLSKNSLKERLYELLGMSTLVESRVVGYIAIKLLKYLIEEQLSRGVSLIAEAPFMFKGDDELLREWVAKFDVRLVCIRCTVDSEVRRDRFKKRPRHRAHHDAERSVTDDPMNMIPSDTLPGQVLVLNTEKPVSELVDYIVLEAT